MMIIPPLVVVIPLIAALICPIVSYFNRVVGRMVVVLGAATTLVLTVCQLYLIVKNGKSAYWFGNWKPPFGIEFVIDSLSGTIMVLVAAIGFLSTVYSLPFFKGESRFKSCGYFSILSMLICGLLGMTATGDVFNLYVFLEITSISGYVLIAMGGEKGVLSAFRYLLIGTIGASFYLLGVAFIYGETGTLNMHDMSGLVGPVLTSKTTMIAMAFFVIGFGIKMALFPLHGWQPEAYTNAHPGASPIITGVMGKIPAYAMLRYFFFVFNAHSDYVEKFLLVVGIMSVCGMIYGSLKAIAQTDLRRMLAYSSIAQVGYIGVGIALTGYYGLIGAVLHIISHGTMKSCLFFCAGAIQYRIGETKIRYMGQLQKIMPWTVGAMTIAALSMIGIPPFAGFFSKWYLALGAVNKGYYIYVLVLVISSLLNAVYFFKLLEQIYMNKETKIHRFHPFKSDDERLPLTMKMPILITAAAIILIGIFNSQIVGILSATLRGVSL